MDTQQQKSQTKDTRPTLDTKIRKSLSTMPICVSNVPQHDDNEKTQVSVPVKKPAL